MSQNSPKSILSVPLVLLIGACTHGSDWPNLSDKMPDPAERSRVIERADPSTAPRPRDEAPQSTGEAQTLFMEVTRDTEELGAAFEAVFRRLEEASVSEGETQADEELKHHWFEAQLALTRLSQAVNRLDPIIFSETLEGTDVWRRARDHKSEIDQFVMLYRRGMLRFRPEEIG